MSSRKPGKSAQRFGFAEKTGPSLEGIKTILNAELKGKPANPETLPIELHQGAG
jgi:hypothetical protein